MSEENKTVELKDEELEKVSGGKCDFGSAYRINQNCVVCGSTNYIIHVGGSTYAQCVDCGDISYNIAIDPHY